MAKTEVVPATQKLIDSMKGCLRAIDHHECMEINGKDADKAIQIGLDTSLHSWVGLIKGIPFCCFGVASASLLSTSGVPWMLGTDEIARWGATYLVLKNSKYYVDKMLKPFDNLENWVDIRNEISIRWLKWCGFSFDGPVPYGIHRGLFQRFYLNKEYAYV